MNGVGYRQEDEHQGKGLEDVSLGRHGLQHSSVTRVCTLIIVGLVGCKCPSKSLLSSAVTKIAKNEHQNKNIVNFHILMIIECNYIVKILTDILLIKLTNS